MAIIDGSESCFATASGMAAVFASLMCQLQAGDHVVSATALFGSCREVIKNIITRYGIEVSFVDGKNIESWKKEIKSNTKIFFFETPSNPCLELVDIEAVCKLAKKNNIKVVLIIFWYHPFCKIHQSLEQILLYIRAPNILMVKEEQWEEQF